MAALTFLTRFNPKIIAIISFIVLLIAVIIGFFVYPKFIYNTLNGMNLKPGSDQRKLWSKTPFPLTFKIYVFNITNPMEVVEGKKPKLQQIGPYVFSEWKSKNILSDDEEEDSVTFELINTYFFRPDLSNGLTGEEIVNVPHPLLMGALIAAQRDRAVLLGIIVKAFQQIFRPEGSPFLSTKVMDLFFRGIGVDCDRDDMEASIVCGQIGTEKGIQKINETFYSVSIFGDKNGTSSGKFKVNRGVKDIRRLGEVIMFEDKTESTAYSGHCNNITGTDGTIFAPYHTKGDIIHSFSPAFCRSIGTMYRGDGSYNSIPTAIYNIEFEDLKKDPKKHCFCRQQDPEKCPPKGTIDIYSCIGMPFIISKPHFLDADKSLISKVDGMEPVKRDHDNMLQFEMITGTPISVKNRIQFSMQIEKISAFDLMANLEPIIMPFFWIEESLDLDKSVTNMLRYGLYTSQTVVSIIKYGGIILGLIGLVFAGYQMFEGDSKKVSVPPPTIINPISARTLQSTIDSQKY